MIGIYVAEIRDGRLLLTGRVTQQRAIQLAAIHSGAWIIYAPDRETAYRKALKEWPGG